MPTIRASRSQLFLTRWEKKKVMLVSTFHLKLVRFLLIYFLGVTFLHCSLRMIWDLQRPQTGRRRSEWQRPATPEGSVVCSTKNKDRKHISHWMFHRKHWVVRWLFVHISVWVMAAWSLCLSLCPNYSKVAFAHADKWVSGVLKIQKRMRVSLWVSKWPNSLLEWRGTTVRWSLRLRSGHGPGKWSKPGRETWPSRTPPEIPVH